jgi:hypothetical protein
VSELLTLLNVPLTLVPSALMIVMHATRISASMTAYSTAVGPSSLVRNREIERIAFCIEPVLLESVAEIRDVQSNVVLFHRRANQGDRVDRLDVDLTQQPKCLPGVQIELMGPK